MYNFDIDKIILCGDSAGGNLIASLQGLLIKTGIRKADGLMLIYPALNLDGTKFTPSFELALEETFLPYSFLRLCLDAYLGDNSD